MATYSAGMTAAGIGTTLQPIFGLLNTAAIGAVLKQVTLFNTTATACTYRLVSLTGGTPGATVTAYKQRNVAPANACLAKQLWTANATIVADTGYRFPLGAAVGSGIIMPIHDLEGDLGATAGFGLVAVGTGQICEVQFVWEE